MKLVIGIGWQKTFSENRRNHFFSKYDVKCRAAASKILVYVKDSFRSALERNVDIHSMLRGDNYTIFCPIQKTKAIDTGIILWIDQGLL